MSTLGLTTPYYVIQLSPQKPSTWTSRCGTKSCPASPSPVGTALHQRTQWAQQAVLQLQKQSLFLAQGMFFYRAREDQELENHAVEPVIKETERMVYVAFSEYFFDSAMHAYFQAGVLAIELEGEKVSSRV